MATVAAGQAGRAAAQDPGAAWDGLRELAARAPHDRDGALAELDRRFLAGRASEGIDGELEGLVVAFAAHPALDRAAAALARRVMPWSGKRFDAAASRGENLMLGGRASGLGFRTRVERSALHPGLDVLVLDYGAVRRNPRPVRQVRDELVEVAPGVHLGAALVRRRGRLSLTAWWALRRRG